MNKNEKYDSKDVPAPIKMKVTKTAPAAKRVTSKNSMMNSHILNQQSDHSCVRFDEGSANESFGNNTDDTVKSTKFDKIIK